MSPFKEVILSCLLMMHVFFIASRPTELELNVLKRNLREMAFSLCTLKGAEKDYINNMFRGKAPNGYKSEPLDGITKEEIQTSICSITDYLENHLPLIIRSTNTKPEGLIKRIKAFVTQFKANAGKGQNTTISLKTSCHRNVTTASDFEKKTTGLRIIYFTRQWVEHHANDTCGST